MAIINRIIFKYFIIYFKIKVKMKKNLFDIVYILVPYIEIALFLRKLKNVRNIMFLTPFWIRNKRFDRNGRNEFWESRCWKIMHKSVEESTPLMMVIVMIFFFFQKSYVNITIAKSIAQFHIFLVVVLVSFLVRTNIIIIVIIQSLFSSFFYHHYQIDYDSILFLFWKKNSESLREKRIYKNH